MKLISRTAVTAGLAAAAMVVGIAVAPAASAATAAFVRTASWGSGYEAKFTVTNNTSSTITSWNVVFDLPSGTSISSFWDADMTRSGQRFTFVNKSWNGTLGPNGTASFGFIAAGNGDPTNCTVNGSSCAGGPPPNPGTPATPGNVRVTGTTANSISVAWNASTGATGYRVYEGTTVRATVTGTSATIGGLPACTSRSYTVAAYNAQGESAKSGAVSGTTTGCTGGGGAMSAAPYIYSWGNVPNLNTVMSATGIKWFTKAFVLSGGGCTPAWDGNRPINSAGDAQQIASIRAAGGDIIPSVGGWSGNKLGPNCSSASALAGALQQVINAYNLKAIDLDVENTDEFESEVVQDRILGALKILKQNNPSLKTIVTIPTAVSGPSWWGTRLINQGAALQANVDVWTIMPFNFGGGADMYASTVSSAEGLRNALKTAFGWSDATAYAHMGISGMNGRSDQNEITTTAQWTSIRDWAKARGLARLAFWSVNRDRGCAGGPLSSDCSSIAQPDWEFTRITAQFS
ncbi:cellulose binding domain-containing protein [Asanoa iriomotensis]|uniref:Chitinase n=1 Tax=Asanoa iriomotensis TaxID=234613 RepID=A0ABQ4C2Y6_9ACTN|nr:cellulose binding domain-containing protein [Asanoa iriomotensis]GIF57119.1 chitinase [Asanoa iriomotensis]